MRVSTHCRQWPAAVLAVLMMSGPAAVAAQPAPAGWTHAAGEARVVLPAPIAASMPAVGTEISCQAQLWTLALALEQPVRAPVQAKLSVGQFTVETSARAEGSGLVLDVPWRAIEPIRSMNRLEVTLDGIGDFTFPLNGSRRALTAAEALCSPRELPSLDAVALDPDAPDNALARRLRADDIADFELSTTIAPQLRAGRLDMDGGRSLLFAELCGSSWYYGVSGCSLAGYALETGNQEEWRLVFEAEGVHLYADPDNSRGGWPDLIGLPRRAGNEARWTWSGDRYRRAPARDIDRAQEVPGTIAEKPLIDSLRR